MSAGVADNKCENINKQFLLVTLYDCCMTARASLNNGNNHCSGHRYSFAGTSVGIPTYVTVVITVIVTLYLQKWNSRKKIKDIKNYKNQVLFYFILLFSINCQRQPSPGPS